jgi:galactokinase
MSMAPSDQLLRNFTDVFGGDSGNVRLFFAPGRVNLIGEHTDYNNGFVLPCALTFGTYLAIRENDSGLIRFRSENFSFSAELPVDEKERRRIGEWIDYPLGVIEVLKSTGMEIPGADLFFSGDIPAAAGLSSSASIEMVTAFALDQIQHGGMSVTELAHLCQKAENEFVGVNCGIMDQFAVGNGKKDSAILLNCGTMMSHLVPVHIPDHRLVVVNTGKERGLAGSRYNERVNECRMAVQALSSALTIRSLGEIGWDQFCEYSDRITDPVVLRRARHVVSENKRVLEAVKALMNGDIDRFGGLMVESHESLRDDYEVTGFELDTMTRIQLEQEGVLGARMTGAGFGGCTVAFVKTDRVEEFMKVVSEEYRSQTGLKPGFYLPGIGDGVKEIIH